MVYKITATLIKPGNTAVAWTHYSVTRMTPEQCEKRFHASLKSGLASREKTRVENFCCEKSE
ncbi:MULTISPECIES: DUF1187 family protein [Citrobacter]|uniref:DUF1187 family protein n=1 Tax=Citrobacter TaxID=544 RepID=UPI0011EED3F0|nr:DUF1187 family protein [Citrobacter braakii]